MATFSSFNLDKELVAALKTLGYETLSPIQEQAIPLILKGVGGVFKAPTGTGKTLAYIAPIVSNISTGTTVAIVILPTKVLCSQLGSVLKDIRRLYPYFSYSVIGELHEKEDVRSADIVVTTPGIYLSIREKLNLKNLQYLVFDEGDMLIFGGFEEEIQAIMSYENRAVKYLFSASIDEHLNTLVGKYLGAKRIVDVAPGEVTSNHIKHAFVDIRHLSKGEALVRFLALARPYKTIAFVSAKKDITAVEQVLLEHRIPHAVVHGDLPKRDQKNAVKAFAQDRVNLLLASDIAARGFDIADVTDVISLDLPKDMNYYFHRAGRAGRFHTSGTSYVFYSHEDNSKAQELLKKAGTIFAYFTLKDDELKPDRNLNTIVKRKLSNIYVETEIRKAIAKTHSKKVKPCYKKKVRQAIEIVKRKHKEDIIKTNIKKKQADR